MDEAVARAPSGWPARRAARRRARGLRGGRSRRRPARRGFRNSPGSSPPIPRAVGGGRPEPRHAAGLESGVRGIAGRRVAERTVEMGFRRFKKALGDVQSSALRLQRRVDGRRHSRRRRSAPAACGSSTSTQRTPSPGHSTNGARTRASSNCCVVEAAECRRQPRSVRISASCVAMMSITRPNRVFRANSRPRSASRCTSASGSPAARRFVIRLCQRICREGEVADAYLRHRTRDGSIAAHAPHVSSRTRCRRRTPCRSGP